MTPYSQLEEAEIRVEMRRLYRDVGFMEAIGILGAMLVTASILAEVLVEEKENEKS